LFDVRQAWEKNKRKTGTGIGKSALGKKKGDVYSYLRVRTKPMGEGGKTVKTKTHGQVEEVVTRAKKA